jgi:hypothetical protein
MQRADADRNATLRANPGRSALRTMNMTPPTARAAAEGLARSTAARSWYTALQTPPTEFYPRFGLLPAVVGVQHQPATWDEVGFTRTLALSDGGTVVETITHSERGEFFGYDLSQFTRLFGHLVSGARAEWTFTEHGGATLINWTYGFHPLPCRGLIVRAIVKTLWAPYMRRVMPGIVDAIEKSAPR